MNDRFVLFLRDLIVSVIRLFTELFNPLFTFINAPVLYQPQVPYTEFDWANIPGFIMDNIGALLQNGMVEVGKSFMSMFGLPSNATIMQAALVPGIVLAFIIFGVWKSIVLGIFR